MTIGSPGFLSGHVIQVPINHVALVAGGGGGGQRF
jgi:hypothetical protein